MSQISPFNYCNCFSVLWCEKKRLSRGNVKFSPHTHYMINYCASNTSWSYLTLSVHHDDANPIFVTFHGLVYFVDDYTSHHHNHTTPVILELQPYPNWVSYSGHPWLCRYFFIGKTPTWSYEMWPNLMFLHAADQNVALPQIDFPGQHLIECVFASLGLWTRSTFLLQRMSFIRNKLLFADLDFSPHSSYIHCFVESVQVLLHSRSPAEYIGEWLTILLLWLHIIWTYFLAKVVKGVIGGHVST